MKMEFNDVLSECPVIAIVRGADPDEILAVAEAIIRPGIRLVEVTMNSTAPLESIAILAERFAGSGVLIGAGTVLDPSDVAKIAEAGGEYIISPNVNIDVIRETKVSGLVSLPGFFTPSEAFTALEAGADYLKCFPAVLGSGYIKALKAVVPAPILAVGGVDLINAREFLQVADGVGVGSGIYKKGKSLLDIEQDAARYIAVATRQ